MSAPSKTLLTARIVEWDAGKGYGFLGADDRRVFLHIHDFAERHKKPEVGDNIHFTLGEDSKGRTCAKNAAHVNDGGRITGLNLLVLSGLFVLPVLALHWREADFRWVSAYALVISTLAYAAYALDKSRARMKAWRLSETGLHLLELLGGWPGAFVAQRRLRHKSSKPRYQIVFWLIIMAYQFAALDSLQEWHLSRAALHSLQPSPLHRR